MDSNPTPIGRGRVWIVLAAFNEAPALPALLQHMAGAMNDTSTDYTILLVDDGSTDETADIAAGFADVMPIEVHRHATNLGLGATIRDGLWFAADAAQPNDIIVTLDADNTHTPGLIARMVRMVREGHDVVIASRYRPGSRVIGVPISRRLLSRVGSMFLRVVFPVRGVRDYTSGYRAYRAEAIQNLITAEGQGFRRSDGFQVMIDILLTLRSHRDFVFGEVPLILRYDFKEGKSKMNVAQTVADTLRLVWVRRWRRNIAR